MMHLIYILPSLLIAAFLYLVITRRDKRAAKQFPEPIAFESLDDFYQRIDLHIEICKKEGRYIPFPTYPPDLEDIKRFMKEKV